MEKKHPTMKYKTNQLTIKNTGRKQLAQRM